MNNREYLSFYVLLFIVFASFLPSCKQNPDSKTAKEQEQTEFTFYDQKKGRVDATTYSPNDISISLKSERFTELLLRHRQGYTNEPFVEPNTLSETKGYHYKPLFYPLDGFQDPNPFMDRLYK